MTIPFSHYAPDPHVPLLFQCFSTKESQNKYKTLQVNNPWTDTKYTDKRSKTSYGKINQKQ